MKILATIRGADPDLRNQIWSGSSYTYMYKLYNYKNCIKCEHIKMHLMHILVFTHGKKGKQAIGTSDADPEPEPEL
jgi:hypothetical protein